MEDKNGGQISTRAIGSSGRQTTVNLEQNALNGRSIKSIKVVGREDSSLSDTERNTLALRVLQGVHRLEDSSFIEAIWFPRNAIASPPKPSADVTIPYHFSSLNPSQRSAAISMLDCDANPILLCHGPPGTGKTRTIAAVVKELDATGQPSWLCAQSNVGVKNIAEKLFKEGVDFRLIVSKDFYVEWYVDHFCEMHQAHFRFRHEEIYEKIIQKVVRLDEIRDPRQVETDIRQNGICTILCTISMLSNPGVAQQGFYRHVPVQRLMVDEASQIYVGQYIVRSYTFRCIP